MEEIVAIPEGETVVEVLTRSMFINEAGLIRVRWTRENKGEIQSGWEEPKDIETTHWQQLHILERYLRQLRTHSAWTPGELARVHEIIRRILKIAEGYLQTGQLSQENTQDQIAAVIRLIGAVRNQYKEAAQLRMKIVGSSLKTAGAEKMEQLGSVIDAAGDMTKRAEQILKLCRGVLTRLERLEKKRQDCVQMLTNIYRQLNRLHKKDQLISMEHWSERDLAKLKRMFDPKKASLIGGLAIVNVQPYLGRANLPEIKRLERIPKYLDGKDFGSIRRTFAGAMTRLERVMAEVDKSFSPPAIGKEMKRRVEQ